MIVVCAPSPKMTRQSNRGLPMVVASAVDHASAGLAPLSRSDEWNLRFAGAPDCRRQLRHRHVASDHTTRADHRIVANTHARQNNCATADPHITTDADRATKLQSGPPRSSIAWVIGGEDLNPWPDLSPVSNSDLYDIENHAVEVQEHTRTETDIEAVVAVKGGRIIAPSPTAARRSTSSSRNSDGDAPRAAL